MDTLRNLPLYFQDFEDLRRKNYLYVDKTQYLARLVTRYKDFFLSRPIALVRVCSCRPSEPISKGKRTSFRGFISDERKKR